MFPATRMTKRSPTPWSKTNLGRDPGVRAPQDDGYGILAAGEGPHPIPMGQGVPGEGGPPGIGRSPPGAGPRHPAPSAWPGSAGASCHPTAPHRSPQALDFLDERTECVDRLRPGGWSPWASSGRAVVRRIRWCTITPTWPSSSRGSASTSRPNRYMEDVASCYGGAGSNPRERVHFHENNPDVVHVHAAGATWGHLFQNLGWSLGRGT